MFTVHCSAEREAWVLWMRYPPRLCLLSRFLLTKRTVQYSSPPLQYYPLHFLFPIVFFFLFSSSFFFFTLLISPLSSITSSSPFLLIRSSSLLHPHSSPPPFPFLSLSFFSPSCIPVSLPSFLFFHFVAHFCSLS